MILPLAPGWQMVALNLGLLLLKFKSGVLAAFGRSDFANRRFLLVKMDSRFNQVIVRKLYVILRDCANSRKNQCI